MLWLAILSLLAPPPRRHVVEIRGMAFHPSVLTVAVGDTVIWINRDIVPHTATAGGRPTWDTGQLMQGEQDRYVPRRGGEAPYVCTLHPTMQGKLIIQ
jgi:plastocyanin